MRSWIVAAACALVACGSPPPPSLSVGEVTFTEDQLLGLSPARRETLAYLTAFGLSVADSTTADLGAPRVAEWTDDRLLEILAAELTLEKHSVDDAVLEARYLTDPEWELTIRHILFFSERWRSPTHRAEAKAKAERAMELLRGGADFPETAARLSEEPGAEGRQGLLTPGREGSWVPEFWAAALALQPGEISPVTETQYGYHILQLDKRTVVPFAEARSVVAREVADRLEDPDGVLQAWMAEHAGEGDPTAGRPTPAGRLAALAEALRRGLTVPDGERAELERRWDDQTYQWSLAFGFRYGAGPAQVGATALAALASPSQNADIYRTQLSADADLLRARYPMTFAETGG